VQSSEGGGQEIGHAPLLDAQRLRTKVVPSSIDRLLLPSVRWTTGTTATTAQDRKPINSRNDYDFLTVWRVPGTVDEVTAILSDAASLPRWWPAVYLSATPLPSDDGSVQSFLLHTKGWLPYTLRWTLTPSGPVTRQGFALTATGDLNGTGRWTFVQEGAETVITYHWHVTVAKPLLRRLSWLLKPVFAANHRWAMARGEESLARELIRRRN
jgi:hypothetical protein